MKSNLNLGVQMKTLLITLLILLSSLLLQASSTDKYTSEEKSIYACAQEAGNKASNVENAYLDTKEKCNVAYGKLNLTSDQESHIDIYIKGFFEGCTHPHS